MAQAHDRIDMNSGIQAEPLARRKRYDTIFTHTTLPKRRVNLSQNNLEFGSSDVCQLARVTLRQLQWWDERNVLSPEQQGHRRVYDVSDVLGMMVIGELRRKGLSLQKLRGMVRSLRRKIDGRLDDLLGGNCNLYMLTDGKASYLEDQPDRIVAILKDSRTPLSLVSVGDQARRLAEYRDNVAASRRRQANAQFKLF